MTTAGVDPTSVAEQARRQAFREFVRQHHPDRGGDPVAFRAGLELFGRGAHDTAPHRPVITVHRRRQGLGVLLDWAVERRARRRRPPRVH